MLFKLLICICIIYQVATLQCYTGIDSQCMVMDISSSENGCGDGVPVKNCTCAKYRVPCTPGDTACTDEEIRLKTAKWIYMVSTDEMCNQLKLVPQIYQQLKCCKKNKCNAPQSKSVKCMSMFPMAGGAGKKKKAPSASRRQNTI